MHNTPICNLIDCLNCGAYNPISIIKCSKIEKQWLEFGDVPMDPETECIECDWNGFPAGTHREDIWHWFESTYNIRVYDLLYKI